MFKQIIINSFWYPLPSIVIGFIIFFYFAFYKKNKIPYLDALFLILIPALGLGNFIYKEELKHSKSKLLPRKWFVNYYMSKVHIAITIIAIIFYTIEFSVYLNSTKLGGPNYSDYLFSFFEVLGLFLLQLICFMGMAIIGFLLIFIPHNNAQTIALDFFNPQHKTPIQNIVKHTFAKRIDIETNTTYIYQFTNLFIRREIIVKNNDIYFLSTENPLINGEKLTSKLLNEFNFDSNEYIEFEEFKSYWNLK